MGFFTEKQPEIMENDTLVMDKPVVEEKEQPVLHMPKFDKPEPKEEAPAPAPEEEKELESEVFDEMGIIAAGTTVHGHIKTKGHLAIAGTVDGSVTCANLMLTGTVKGDIDCNNIVLDGGTCTSMLKVRGSLSVKQNTTIEGDVYCKHITVMGTVNGNIIATGNVGLSKSAIIKGYIKAAVLAVEPGAKIEGKVSIG